MMSKRWFKPQPKGLRQEEEWPGINHCYIIEVTKRAFGIAFWNILKDVLLVTLLSLCTEVEWAKPGKVAGGPHATVGPMLFFCSTGSSLLSPAHSPVFSSSLPSFHSLILQFPSFPSLPLLAWGLPNVFQELKCCWLPLPRAEEELRPQGERHTFKHLPAHQPQPSVWGNHSPSPGMDELKVFSNSARLALGCKQLPP